MKNYSYLLCLFAISSCLGNGSAPSSWLGKWKDLHGLDAQAERPCPRYDLNCIRRYFTTHSHCTGVNGRVPDPLLFPLITTPLAGPNITIVSYDSRVSGLNGRVTEFAVNRRTNNVVLAVQLTNITIDSPRTTFRYHRLRREPIALTDDFYLRYESVTLTAVFPNVDNLDLENMEVFAYIHNVTPYAAFGRRIIRSNDPIVIGSYTSLVLNWAVSIKEAFIVRGPLFMTAFIQRTICNFGS